MECNYDIHICMAFFTLKRSFGVAFSATTASYVWNSKCAPAFIRANGFSFKHK